MPAMMLYDEACRFAGLMIKRVTLIFTLICLSANFLHAQGKVNLKIVYTDKGNEAFKEQVDAANDFSSANEINEYLRKQFLPKLWYSGYLSASIDSMQLHNQQLYAYLFLGEKYYWGEIKLDNSFNGIISKSQVKILPTNGAVLQSSSIAELVNLLLNQLEESGYPFASIKLDSSYWYETKLCAQLKVDAGPLYHIDSIHVDSRLHINPTYLQRHLGLHSGQIYSRSVLQSVSKRLEDLGYIKELKPWDLSLYATGATLNLYLQPEKNNRFDLLLGLMPSNPSLNGRAQFTGDGTMELNNAFGNGEHLFVNWQQLQIQSPRLQLNFDRPYVFNSNMGIDIKFNLLKKDSSYINLFSSAGIQYRVDQKQLLKFNVIQHLSNVLNVDTQLIKQNKSLQSFLDISNTQMGIEWSLRSTDDRRNPLKGSDLNVQVGSGLKKIRKQEAVLALKKDASGNSFDFGRLYNGMQLTSVQSNVKIYANKYNQIGKNTTLKLSTQAAWMYGKQIFLNEMYQIGGIKTLRGFDEESIFASSFAIGTAEFRYLLDKYSNVFGFLDGAFVQKNLQGKKQNRNFLGVGMGLNFMTKSGMFSMAYALGKSDQQEFGLKNSKIHVGFSTLF